MYQRHFFNELAAGRDDGGTDRAAVIWHRRAGKDLVSLNVCATWVYRRVGLYWHILPTYAQGRKIVWNGITSEGRAFLDHFPQHTIVKQRDDEMRLEFDNGSVYQVVGGDNIDRLVGSNPIGCIFSEYSLQNPACWNLIRPILNENKGWAGFIYTPRGYNHGWELYESAKENPRWFTEILTVNDTRRPDGTPVVTDEDIQDDIRSGMPEELVRQEYYCDFSAPLVGSYYGQLLDEAEKEGRVCPLPWRTDLPYFTGWDLGMSDATAIWIGQCVGDWVHWMDYKSGSGVGLEHYAQMLFNLSSDKKIVMKDHYGPHDIKVRELGTGKSRLDVMWELGIKMMPVPRLSIEDGVNAARMLLRRSKFNSNSEGIKEGLIALRHYRKVWDERNRIWGSRPVHDWSSHPSDAFRTAAVALPNVTPSIDRGRTKWGHEETLDEIRARRERSAQIPVGKVRQRI